MAYIRLVWLETPSTGRMEGRALLPATAPLANGTASLRGTSIISARLGHQLCYCYGKGCKCLMASQERVQLTRVAQTTLP
jgi:hypothetical protein